MQMTRRILCYIHSKALCTEKIAEETGVRLQMLSGQCQDSFSASEMLEICNYLQIDPYYFWGDGEDELPEGDAGQ